MKHHASRYVMYGVILISYVMIITLSSRNHYVTVSMTPYVDIGHKVLFGVITVSFRPLRNDYVMIA